MVEQHGYTDVVVHILRGKQLTLPMLMQAAADDSSFFIHCIFHTSFSKDDNELSLQPSYPGTG